MVINLVFEFGLFIVISVCIKYKLIVFFLSDFLFICNCNLLTHVSFLVLLQSGSLIFSWQILVDDEEEFRGGLLIVSSYSCNM